MSSLPYIGHVLTADGLKPDPQKIRALQEMPAPTNVAGVRRLLGMVNYLARFLPNLAEKCTRFRRLTQQDVMWQWGDGEETDFKRLKDELTTAPVLRYFDERLPVTVQSDASGEGLGAVLLQQGQPVAYASRALTSAETRYAQIEKELLGIIFGLERFHQYTYGRQDIVAETDHKPLEAISRKPLHLAPKRLQRMLLRLQAYTPEVRYKKGSEMFVADALSRAYLNDDDTTKDDPDVRQFHEELEAIRMTAMAPLTDKTIADVREATAGDTDLQTIARFVQQGWPESRSETTSSLRPYLQ